MKPHLFLQHTPSLQELFDVLVQLCRFGPHRPRISSKLSNVGLYFVSIFYNDVFDILYAFSHCFFDVLYFST